MEDQKKVKQDESVKAKIELEIEELEPIVAPRLAANHNETLVRE